LGYATSNRGGSHHDTRAVYEEPDGDPGFVGQAEYCVKSQNATAVGDSLVMCRFFTERLYGKTLGNSLLPLIKYTTGWDMDLNEINTIGDRIYTLERYINTKRGLNRRKDTLPYRVLNVPIPDGPSRGRVCSKHNLEEMLDEYYKIRGWDSNGIPTEETLKQLQLIK
jgi:aldehyde:ferredoxin oxidoreductase